MKCTGVLEACAELEEDLAGLLEALSRIFDPATCFHQHNKNQDAGGIRVRPLRPCPAPSPILVVMNRHMHCMPVHRSEYAGLYMLQEHAYEAWPAFWAR